VLSWSGNPSTDPYVWLLLLAGSSLAWIAPAGLSAGLAAWPLLRRDLASALREYGVPNHQRVLGGLAALHVAIAIALLFPALLLNHRLANLLSVDLGFSPDHALAVQLYFPGDGQNGDRRQALLAKVLDRLRLSNAIESVGLTTSAPFSQHSFLLRGGLEFVSAAGAPPLPIPNLKGEFVTPGYVHALGLRLIRGRDMQGGDSSHEIFVDGTFEREVALGSALGSMVRWRGDSYNVVGVVHATRELSSSTATPTIYLPLQVAEEVPWVFIVARAQGRLDVAADEIVRSVQAVDERACVADPVSLKGILQEGLRPRRRILALCFVAACVAVLLSLLSSFLATQHIVVVRRREIAIRMAMGAPPSCRLSVVVRHAFGPLVGGFALGGLGAWAMASLLESQLYGASAGDIPAMVGVVLVACAVSVASALVPTLDAWRLDVAATLRET